MENLGSESIEGGYAAYAVTPASEHVLRKISEDIITTIQHADKLLKKPDIIIPQSYHMTLDYRGKLQNIEEYIQEIIARKIASKETTLWFPAMDEWRSNIDDRTIIHARPTRQQQAKIPFNVREGYNAHLTLADIENTENFRLWFLLHIDRFVDLRRNIREETDNPMPIEVDTSKVQIRGKIEGKKELIIEV